MKTNQHFETESGAHYEFATDGAIRRHVGRDGNVKRADEQWVRVLGVYPDPVVVGESVTLVMESLSFLGPDDQGTVGGGVTTRTTTPVVRVWTEKVA